jgi:sporulation protein YlmC with PRC-barrel domain
MTTTMRSGIRIVAAMAVAAVISMSAASAGAQVAGSSTIGVTKEEIKAVMEGWSAKKAVLGKAVYNDKNEKIGTIDDLIIAPDRSVSYAIIGAGGFVGIGKHDVAIPMSQLKLEKDKFILPGATKEALKAMPKFEYAKVEKKK